MSSRFEQNPEYFVTKLLQIQEQIQKSVIKQLTTVSTEQLSRVVLDAEGDTLYALDTGIEGILLKCFEDWSEEISLVLVCEGLPEGGITVFPKGLKPNDAEIRVIVDPIDGTRGMMYDKRSAWVLSGVAPNRGGEGRLSDIRVAVQSEIPTTKQYLADRLWAVRGKGAIGERLNVLTGERRRFTPRPSTATGLEHGFAMLSKFFPGGKEIIASIEEAIASEMTGGRVEGKVKVFDDQYISTGGQLYELMVGHDRFNGDIRAALVSAAAGMEIPGMSCHPYDLATILIAQEAGIVLTDLYGRTLDGPMNVSGDMAWIGYANSELQRRIEPILQRELKKHNLV
jgi:hypothetical protein